jgi:hypothetical protein
MRNNKTGDNRASERALELERMTNAQLERVFLRGTTPNLDALLGWEFRGLNTPTWFRLLGIKKFIKGFYRRDGDAYGYNSPTVQNRLGEPWLAKPRDDSPKRFGFYRVGEVDATARDNAYLHALLLDYGKGGNSRFDPTAGLRDYLVQVDPNNPDLYLGKAYYAFGPARLPTYSFFILERHRPGLQDVSFR